VARDTVVQASRVPAPAEAVWARVTSIEGVNHELAPWLRMTVPRRARGLSLDDLEPGRPAGRSWVLLGGVLPVDYDEVTIVERGPGLRFLERSPMGSMRFWQHERTVTPRGAGECEVEDRLAFEPRLALGRPLARALVARIFAHRHRRLADWFGADGAR
jgi:ligand-binding SRPBCC domain-containing protein